MSAPWQVVKAKNTYGVYNIVGASFKVTIITQATDLTLQDETSRLCDAYMMAASPALYDALENLLATVRGEGGTKYHAHEIAEAALAQARGETA